MSIKNINIFLKPDWKSIERAEIHGRKVVRHESKILLALIECLQVEEVRQQG